MLVEHAGSSCAHLLDHYARWAVGFVVAALQEPVRDAERSCEEVVSIQIVT